MNPDSNKIHSLATAFKPWLGIKAHGSEGFSPYMNSAHDLNRGLFKKITSISP
jgi:hypothetical protein